MKLSELKKIFLLGILIISLAGCGDNSTGPEPEVGTPPAFPELEKSQPDLSYFEKNPTSSENSNFLQAKTLVSQGSSFLFISSAYDGFIGAARDEDASFEGGVWYWNYSTQYQGTEAEMTLTAGELDDAIEWTLTTSFDNSQGNRIKDYRLFEGTITPDGNSGNWMFNVRTTESQEEIPAVITSWQITDETQKTITAEVYFEGELFGIINFEKDLPEYTMTADLGSGEVIIFWNAETNAGFIDGGAQRNCWGVNFENVPCS
ncbi:MAG TPA: hypothetical protein VF181_03300 [Balneolaceae bacterium]